MKTNLKQDGLALLVFTLMISLSALAYFFRNMDTANLRFNREAESQKILALAKEAIISHSITRFAVGERPGDMPRPDYIIETPSNYDGNSDGGCLNATIANGLPQVNSGVNMRCLGRLPWRTVGMTIPIGSQNDVNGSMPWYAVSANLVDSTCLTVLNSNILNLVNNPLTAQPDCSGATLPHPWLTVRDSNGNVVSNRVAVVIIIPGTAIAGQSRPSLPLNGTTAYLDTVTVPAGCAVPCVPGTYSNADFDNSFILHDDKNVTTINDKLIFITIDELMQVVERRAAQEAARQINTYYTNSNALSASRFFPYAANLVDVNYACVNTNLTGRIPIVAYASCTSASLCTTNLQITRVDFTMTSGLSFTSNTGSCSRVAGSCRCLGAGDCRRGLRRFTCTAIGNEFNCQSTGAGAAGTFRFTYTPKTPDVTVVSNGCVGAAGVVNCVGAAGAFSSPPTNCTHSSPSISTLPSWFTDNNWQDLIYYAISNSCSAATPGCTAPDLTVGTRNNVHAVVISSGRALPLTEAQPLPQDRLRLTPPVTFADFLDGLLTNGTTLFEATSKMQANDYNDQPLIVAP